MFCYKIIIIVLRLVSKMVIFLRITCSSWKKRIERRKQNTLIYTFQEWNRHEIRKRMTIREQLKANRIRKVENIDKQ